MGEREYKMEREKFVQILERLAERITIKLRDMNLSQPVDAGSSMPKRLFNELLEQFRWIKQLKADIATADGLSIREAMKTAAKRVAQQEYQSAERGAVSYVVEILDRISWEMADAVANALVKEMATTEKALHAIRRGENSVAGEVLPLRCLIHLAPAHPIRLGHTELAREYMDKIAKEFGPGKVQVEDAGWMLGQLTSTDGVHGTPDGVFMIVRVESADTALALLVFLKSCCAGKVSLAHLFNEDQASRLNAGADQPGIDPLETH